MANATKYIEVLIDSLTKFPGIGRKGAERIAYFIVKSDKSKKVFYNLINEMSPEPRLDVFARKRHDGFESWGLQVEQEGQRFLPDWVTAN